MNEKHSSKAGTTVPSLTFQHKYGRQSKRIYRYEDLTGRSFGYWRVLLRAPDKLQRSGEYAAAWWCICKCHQRRVVLAASLRRNASRSCGCLHRCIKTTHGHSVDGRASEEYRAWQAIKQRTRNTKHKGYPDYGGRGIQMCNRWFNSFEQFLKDVGPKPAGRWSIERSNNNKSYVPSNCRWALPKEQARNRRNTRLLAIDGKQRCLAEWADLAGIPYATLYSRLSMGWEPRIAVFGK